VEESRELVGIVVWVLFQQEGHPDMGAKVNPMDGVDAEPRQTGRRKMADGVLGRRAYLHYCDPYSHDENAKIKHRTTKTRLSPVPAEQSQPDL